LGTISLIVLFVRPLCKEFFILEARINADLIILPPSIGYNGSRLKMAWKNAQTAVRGATLEKAKSNMLISGPAAAVISSCTVDIASTSINTPEPLTVILRTERPSHFNAI